MTHDTTGYETASEIAEDSAPPLCLVHYFTERMESPPEGNQIHRRQPPGSRGRVIERDGNLIILEFAAPTPPPPIIRRKRWQGKRHGKSLMGRICDVLMILLLLASFLGCLAAFWY